MIKEVSKLISTLTEINFKEYIKEYKNAVEELKKEGISLGLVNKPVLNVADEDMLARLGKSPLVLVVESQNTKTGLGSRFGTWLLERGYTPKYGYMGSWKEGAGGISEQIPHQGLGPDGIRARAQQMLKEAK